MRIAKTLLTLWAGMAALSAAGDDIFSAARLQKATFENKGDTPLTFNVTASYVDFAAKGTPKVVEALPGFGFRGSDSRRVVVKNHDPERVCVEVPLTRHLTLNPSEKAEVEVPFPHYLSGVLGADTIKWDATDALEVTLNGGENGGPARALSESREVKSNNWKMKCLSDNYRLSLIDFSELAREVQLLPEIEVIPYEVQKTKNEKLFKNFREAFLGDKKIYKIPHVHHRIWLTSEETPVEAPEEAIKLYMSSIDSFPSDWTHIFWCVDPLKIPKTVKTISESRFPIKIRSVTEFLGTMPGRELYNELYRQKYYVAAVDLLKRYVVFQMGGLYSDLGIHWEKELIGLIDKFDRVQDISIHESPLRIDRFCPDLSAFACAPNMRIEKSFFEIIDSFPRLPKSIRDLFKGKNIMKLTWKCALKMLLDSKSSDSTSIFQLDQSDNVYRIWHHTNSWIHGALGNRSITESSYDWFSTIAIPTDKPEHS